MVEFILVKSMILSQMGMVNAHMLMEAGTMEAELMGKDLEKATIQAQMEFGI
eukprot:CAMPEP_0202954532 /NCGR_PEP_ID=MMETSP1395-20130829/50884_1 /ASSEMBLY_ACC=CAM_ASM_000871 /TAXON_ID=5961 /ORGANISM="Blepharisma japonicum, Strain Stock R1072" /LENGTH=51 /DNA_ID=CAMNT_0049670111 /DNA_START=730 /DNA_END=885 /DNA_ORIENTATION=-